MGRKSTKANKTIYQLAREEMGFTREKAGDLMEYVSADRIEKIESEKQAPQPEDVLAMAKAYKSPQLCNYYCTHECPIGMTYVPEIKMKDLSQIVLEMLAALNTLTRKKERLIEISADGVISEDEYADFANIRDELDRISSSVTTLRIWVEKMIADGKIDPEKLEEAARNLK